MYGCSAAAALSHDVLRRTGGCSTGASRSVIAGDDRGRSTLKSAKHAPASHLHPLIFCDNVPHDQTLIGAAPGLAVSLPRTQSSDQQLASSVRCNVWGVLETMHALSGRLQGCNCLGNGTLFRSRPHTALARNRGRPYSRLSAAEQVICSSRSTLDTL